MPRGFYDLENRPSLFEKGLVRFRREAFIAGREAQPPRDDRNSIPSLQFKPILRQWAWKYLYIPCALFLALTRIGGLGISRNPQAKIFCVFLLSCTRRQVKLFKCARQRRRQKILLRGELMSSLGGCSTSSPGRDGRKKSTLKWKNFEEIQPIFTRQLSHLLFCG